MFVTSNGPRNAYNYCNNIHPGPCWARWQCLPNSVTCPNLLPAPCARHTSVCCLASLFCPGLVSPPHSLALFSSSGSWDLHRSDQSNENKYCLWDVGSILQLGGPQWLAGSVARPWWDGEVRWGALGENLPRSNESLRPGRGAGAGPGRRETSFRSVIPAQPESSSLQIFFGWYFRI